MPQKILLADIDMSGRKRPIDPAHRDLIAASIEFKGGGVAGEGLDTPFIIEPAGAKWRGVTGGHRHAALVAAGWTEVEVGKHVKIVEGLHDFGRQITEIDENLCRHELNALDRALFIAERKKLCSEQRRTHGGDRKSAKFNEEINLQSLQLDFSPRFTAEVSQQVGLSERAIALALHIGKKLAPEAVASLRGAKIERNQQQLLALCDEAPEDQVKIAAAIRDGKAKTVVDARVAAGLQIARVIDAEARIVADFRALWTRAKPSTRKIIAADVAEDMGWQDTGRNVGAKK